MAGAVHVGKQIEQAFLYVYAHQCRPVLARLAPDQRQMHGVADVVVIRHHAEFTVIGRQPALAHALDGGFVLGAVADEVGDGADLEAVLGGELFELRQPRHGAVFVHDLANHRRRFGAGEAREVAAGLGVAGAREHTALLRHQREHVPGRDDVGRFGAGLDRDADGGRAVGGGDAGGNALGGFDRNRERGAEPAMHVAAHQRQRKLLAALLRQRQADKAAAEARHEVDVLGARMRGGHQQVAFVLAVFVVHQDDHASPVDFVDDLGDRTDRHGKRFGETDVI